MPGTGSVSLLCRPKCSFKSPFVRKKATGLFQISIKAIWTSRQQGREADLRRSCAVSVYRMGGLN